MIENDLLHLLVHLLLFSKNNITFPFNRLRLQFGILEDIANDVYRLVDVLPETLGIIDSLFPGGIGIQMCAKVLYFKFEITLRATVCALEGHVLEKVSGSVRWVCFGARASIDPYSNCGRLRMRMRLCRDSKTVG